MSGNLKRMGTYITKCGIYFKTNGCGSSHYMGESWGDEYGKEIIHCPFSRAKDCEYVKEFAAKFGTIIGDCEGLIIDDKEYNYENSREKIQDDLSRKSYQKVCEKFGGYCLAIRADGKGGYEIHCRHDTCGECWNKICMITNKERDITPAYLCADKLIPRTYGFIKDELLLKGLRLHKSPKPKAWLDVELKKGNQSILISMFETNHLHRVEIVELDEIAEYFYKGETRSIKDEAENLRDLMNDLTDIANRIDDRLYDFDRWFKEEKGDE